MRTCTLRFSPPCPVVSFLLVNFLAAPSLFTAVSMTADAVAPPPEKDEKVSTAVVYPVMGRILEQQQQKITTETEDPPTAPQEKKNKLPLVFALPIRPAACQGCQSRHPNSPSHRILTPVVVRQTHATTEPFVHIPEPEYMGRAHHPLNTPTPTQHPLKTPTPTQNTHTPFRHNTGSSSRSSEWPCFRGRVR